MKSRYYRKQRARKVARSRQSRSPIRKVTRRFPIKLTIVVFLLVGLGLGLSKTSLASFLTPLSIVSNILSPSGLETSDGRTNFLVLGIDTRLNSTHGSATLTDTIIFASISQRGGNVKVISLPRDLWVPLGKGYSGKINAAYSVGGGVEAVRGVVSRILGVPIHYYVVVDFEGFERALDILGGVMVDVERSFDDYYYPIPGMEEEWCPADPPEADAAAPKSENGVGGEDEEGSTEEDQSEADSPRADGEMGESGDPPSDSEGVAGEDPPEADTAKEEEEKEHPCRWQHVHFDAGPQVMDGETALRYVRSRHAVGEEGNDFARAHRQQRFLLAVKDEVLSLGTFSNPAKLKELYEAYQDTVKTNVGFPEAQKLFDFARSLGEDTIQTFVLDDGSGDAPRLLFTPRDLSLYGGAYVLVPRAGDFSQVHAFVQKTLFGQD